MKRIFGIVTAFCLAMALSVTPAMASQTEVEPAETAAINPDAQEINVTASGSTLRVTGAAKMTLTVYYLTGTKAAVYSVDSDDQSISTTLGKGVYLVKVGKFVRKVSIS